MFWRTNPLKLFIMLFLLNQYIYYRILVWITKVICYNIYEEVSHEQQGNILDRISTIWSWYSKIHVWYRAISLRRVYLPSDNWKMSEGCYSWKRRIPTKIHNLIDLAMKSSIWDIMDDEYHKFLRELSPMSITACYPDYRSKINTALTQEYCKQLYFKTKELWTWIKNRFS